jgi:ribosome recycling factor
MEFEWKMSKKTAEGKMAKSLESLQAQMNTLRVGGANPNMLDRVMVDCFGSPTPLNQVARVGTSGAMQLVVEPFDKSHIKEVEKAILTADLNVTPNSDGSTIRINLPPLTEERRKDLAKQASTISETVKVAIRNIRRDVQDKIKAAEKNKDIGKDDSKGFQVCILRYLV